MKFPERYQLAVVALVVASILWGASFVFAKFAFSELPVSQVVLYRFTLASLALLPNAFIRRVWPQQQDLPLFFLTGFLTVPATYLLQFAGLSLTSVSNAALILGTLPLLMALASVYFYHEILSSLGWIAIGASTLGVVLIIGLPSPEHSLLGDGLVFLSVFVTTAWVLLSKQIMKRYPTTVATGYILAFGTLTLLPISLLWDGLPRLSLSANVWASVLALSLVCTALTHTLWNWGIKHIPASQAGVYVNLEPLAGMVLGVTVLRESLSLGALAGGLLIITAAIITSKQGST